MMQKFADLTGWSFDLNEISAGVYLASGRDRDGRKVEMTGFDPDAVIEQCKRAAIEIVRLG